MINTVLRVEMNENGEKADLPGSKSARLLNVLIGKIKDNRTLLLWCFISTFIWGLIAHAYVFFQDSFSHDSLNEFFASGSDSRWKIALGRVVVPIYRIITRGTITLPWLIGLLSLAYIGAAVFLVVKLFQIRSKVLIVLTAGIFTANITVTATAATYIHDLDCNMLALALAVLAVYLWKRYNKGFLPGMIPVALSLGLYQSYISVTITLILLVLIMSLLDGEKFWFAIRQGLKSVAMLIGGGILYFGALKAVCAITGIAVKSGDYNSIDTILSMSPSEIMHTAIDGYFNTISKYFGVISTYSVRTVLILECAIVFLAGVIFILGLFRKEVGVKEKILALVLVALLPLGMNIVYTLTGGMSHHLMYFAIWLTYLFVLLIGWWCPRHFRRIHLRWKNGIRLALVCLVFVILWGNVQTSNAVYLKKDMEQEATLSLFTRIVYSMEEYDGYVTGETPVVFIGTPNSQLNRVSGFGRIYNITGNGSTSVLGAASRDYYASYFSYVLLNSAKIADSATWSQMEESSEVAAMPCYPEEGSIAMVEGVLVVKLSE